MILRLKAFAARNIFSLIILIAVLAMALAGLITWTYFGVFAAGWLTGLAITYLRTS